MVPLYFVCGLPVRDDSQLMAANLKLFLNFFSQLNNAKLALLGCRKTCWGDTSKFLLYKLENVPNFVLLKCTVDVVHVLNLVVAPTCKIHVDLRLVENSTSPMVLVPVVVARGSLPGT